MRKQNVRAKKAYIEEAAWYTLSCEKLGTKTNQIDSISKALCKKYNPQFDARHKIEVDFVNRHGPKPVLKMRYFGKIHDVMQVIETIDAEFNIYFDTIN